MFNYRDEKDKEILSLYRRMDELREFLRKPVEVIELPKPIRDGFIRTFTLTKQAKLQKDYKILEEVLNATNIAQYSRTRNFDKPQWAPKYTRGVENLAHFWMGENFELRSIREDEYNKLSDKAKEYFINKKITRRWGGEESRWLPCINPSMYEEKINPHYIRYEEKFNHDAISEYHEIENKIESNGWWPRINKLMGWPGRDHGDLFEKSQKDAHKKHDRMNERQKLKNYIDE